ncbi:sensor histidine kinase YesM [Paenibacillus baekrokdamisoli]|uniref:Sensor histidine kinase YesM n=1 Tax=Paenibacillus baekrokdamisoli TaxID=1712516 RepID=A0A3G9IL26_9BACL|nr:sensor histidine kinase [Paenibacillus baekrokdamisoli]MBB3067792.1 two-component system sensor histidine kinase YesM [Paenibacillus baekrokdamisoli]BBH19026.1 sensor histidine kinase YesM [Paenibacillus baekrokdamisoli]
MIFRNIFKNYRFTSKLIITYLLLTVIPMAIIGYVSYWQYNRSIENQVGKYIPRILSQTNDNIDRKLDELQNLSELIYNSNEVVSILRKKTSQSQSRSLQDKFAVEGYLSRTYLSGNYSDVLGVFIYSNNRIFQKANLAYSAFDPNSLPVGQELNFRGKVSIILPLDAGLQFEGAVPYLLIVKPIKDSDNQKTLGTMYIAVTMKFIENVLSELANEDSATLWIMDMKGKIIYHTDSERIGGIYDDARLFPVTDGSFKKMSSSKSELFSVSRSASTSWTLAYRIPMEKLTAQTDRLRSLMITAFVLFVAVTGVISVLLAWNFTRPLIQLRRLMVDVQRGNFQVDMQIRSRDDEIGMLAHRFNAMVKEIRALIQENYQIEIKQKEAQLYALQFQINPHFMYNTLETISMAVEQGERETAVEMVSLLGRMMRFSLSNKRRTIPISEELQHVEDFLQIQKYRFEDALEYAIHSSIESENYGTLKFILQPIVENSIKYGLEHRQKVYIELEIDEVRDENGKSVSIRFSIRDNGVGMDADRLQQVRHMLSDSQFMQRDSGVGLLNVHSRIAMEYGESYGLSIDSEKEKGTVTVLEIPVLPMEDEK